MAFTRIISDLHYGDRASRVKRLPMIAPLLDGPAQVVVNGDSLDTRLGEHPERTRALRDEVLGFFARESPPATLLTGNHDNDISDHHALDLAAGAVFVTHGDVLYDEIVPWGRDVPLIRRLMAEEWARRPAGQRDLLEHRLAVVRHVASRLPQRHQVEPNLWKYIRSYLADTMWPPDRALRILQTWREAPSRAAALAESHRPAARFVVLGHLHKPGVWTTPGGRVVINTGSFCPPLGGAVVDVHAERLVVRRFRETRGEFRTDETIADLALVG